MEHKEYATMFAVEDRHWWYVGMQRITTRLMGRFSPQRTDLQILDAGCGTGAAMEYLSPFGTVTGIDMMGLALHFCQQRGLSRLNQASVIQLPFGNECFDLVTSFDVLCHRTVGDYRHALDEFSRILRPGGHLFLRLPAYDWLQAHHDKVVHTIHRFTVNELRQTLTTSGFVVEKLSYANTLLFPLVAGRRLMERIWSPDEAWSDVHPNPAWQDELLAQCLFAEASWLAHRNLPFGLTVIAIGRKP
jgi:ubiquinone/menaquinone biosynthesis C-methylase UbiE